MDGGHDHRGPGAPGGRRTHELGPEQMGVEEVDLSPPQVRGQGGGCLPVVAVDHGDRDAEPAQAPHRGAIGQADRLDLEPGSVQVEEQGDGTLLRPAHAGRGQQLRNARTLPTAARRREGDGRFSGSVHRQTVPVWGKSWTGRFADATTESDTPLPLHIPGVSCRSWMTRPIH